MADSWRQSRTALLEIGGHKAFWKGIWLGCHSGHQTTFVHLDPCFIHILQAAPPTPEEDGWDKPEPLMLQLVKNHNWCSPSLFSAIPWRFFSPFASVPADLDSLLDGATQNFIPERSVPWSPSLLRLNLQYLYTYCQNGASTYRHPSESSERQIYFSFILSHGSNPSQFCTERCKWKQWGEYEIRLWLYPQKASPLLLFPFHCSN